jgi:hypothetical protein
MEEVFEQPQRLLLQHEGKYGLRQAAFIPDEQQIPLHAPTKAVPLKK